MITTSKISFPKKSSSKKQNNNQTELSLGLATETPPAKTRNVWHKYSRKIANALNRRNCDIPTAVLLSGIHSLLKNSKLAKQKEILTNRQTLVQWAKAEYQYLGEDQVMQSFGILEGMEILKTSESGSEMPSIHSQVLAALEREVLIQFRKDHAEEFGMYQAILMQNLNSMTVKGEHTKWVKRVESNGETYFEIDPERTGQVLFLPRDNVEAILEKMVNEELILPHPELQFLYSLTSKFDNKQCDIFKRLAGKKPAAKAA